MNIRKTFHILILIGFFIGTTGVSISKHYCMGRLMSIAYFDQAKNCSGDHENNMPCCEDIEDFLKVENLTSSDFDFDSAPQLFLISQFDFTELVLKESSLLETSLLNPSPPPLSDPSRVVLFENFRV